MNSVSKKLIELGFSEYEAKAYSVLLSRELLSATEVSKIGEIPQGRVYSILNKLEEKGFCNTYPGAVKKFKAVHPKTAFSGMLKAREQAFENLKDLKDELAEAFENRQTDETPLDYIAILTSKQSQVSKFDDLIKSSKSTLFSFNKKPYATGFARSIKEIDKASAPLKKIIADGTQVRAVFEKEEIHTEDFIAMIEYYSSIGEEVRINDKLPLKMLLSDNTTAMVSLRNNDVSRFKLTSMVVEHSDLTNALSELFEVYWKKSQTIDEYLKEQSLIEK